jgi:uncharacterized membrane protein YfcA
LAEHVDGFVCGRAVSPVVWFVLAGVGTGILGGLFGVGGGEIFVPLLVYLFGFSQHQAQGTSLAVLLPPIGLLAALQYWRAGYVEFRTALLLAAGFFIGASLGALIATRLHATLLRRLFGAFLLLVALHMIFGRHGSS